MTPPTRIVLMEAEAAPVCRAQLARIVHEAPAIIFRVQTEDGEQQFVLTRDQLFGINADSANILAGVK